MKAEQLEATFESRGDAVSRLAYSDYAVPIYRKAPWQRLEMEKPAQVGSPV